MTVSALDGPAHQRLVTMQAAEESYPAPLPPIPRTALPNKQK